MKSLVLFSAIFSKVLSSGVYLTPGVTVGLTPYSHPVQSQYHAQDVYGQYAYGYSTPTTIKNEQKTADGVTRGGYSYIDSYGYLQTVEYIADAIHGFRVAATNLPQDLPDVAYAKAKHIAAVEATKAEHAAIAAQRTIELTHPVLPVQDLPEVAYAKAQHLAQYAATKAEHEALAAQAVAYSNPVAVPVASVPQVVLTPLPSPVQDLPEVIKARAEHLAAVEAARLRDATLRAEHAARISPIPAAFSGAVVPLQASAAARVPAVAYSHSAPVAYTPIAYQVPTSSQYHAQDELGQYSYGYAEPWSTKSETKTADGITRGGYSYIDANGVLQTVHYISDPVNGFRVAATNLPVGPANHISAPAPAVPVTDSPVIAKAVGAGTHPGVYTHEVYY